MGMEYNIGAPSSIAIEPPRVVHLRVCQHMHTSTRVRAPLRCCYHRLVKLLLPVASGLGGAVLVNNDDGVPEGRPGKASKLRLFSEDVLVLLVAANIDSPDRSPTPPPPVPPPRKGLAVFVVAGIAPVAGGRDDSMNESNEFRTALLTKPSNNSED